MTIRYANSPPVSGAVINPFSGPPTPSWNVTVSSGAPYYPVTGAPSIVPGSQYTTGFYPFYAFYAADAFLIDIIKRMVTGRHPSKPYVFVTRQRKGTYEVRNVRDHALTIVRVEW